MVSAWRYRLLCITYMFYKDTLAQKQPDTIDYYQSPLDFIMLCQTHFTLSHLSLPQLTQTHTSQIYLNRIDLPLLNLIERNHLCIILVTDFRHNPMIDWLIKPTWCCPKSLDHTANEPAWVDLTWHNKTQSTQLPSLLPWNSSGSEWSLDEQVKNLTAWRNSWLKHEWIIGIASTGFELSLKCLNRAHARPLADYICVTLRWPCAFHTLYVPLKMTTWILTYWVVRCLFPSTKTSLTQIASGSSG